MRYGYATGLLVLVEVLIAVVVHVLILGGILIVVVAAIVVTGVIVGLLVVAVAVGIGGIVVGVAGTVLFSVLWATHGRRRPNEWLCDAAPGRRLSRALGKGSVVQLSVEDAVNQ